MGISGGSVLKIKDRPLPWRYSFRFNGRVITKSGFSTRSAALKAMEAKKRSLIDYGGEIDKTEFTEAYEIYLKDLEGDNSHTTLMNKVTYGKRFKKFFSGLYLHKISQLDVQRYKSERKRAGTHKTRTIDMELTTLKHFFNWAIKHGHLRENPAREIKKFNDDYRRGVSLTREQGRCLIEVADPDLKLRLTLALGCGLRHGEITGIKKEDVDFLNGTIKIHRLKKRRTDVVILKVPEEVLTMMKELKPGKGKRAEYIFPFLDCEKRFKTALEKVGIDPKTFRFHDLRHTAASWQLQNGKDLETIRKFLGHSDIQTTQRYLHVDDKQVEIAAAETIESLLGGGGKEGKRGAGVRDDGKIGMVVLKSS